MIRTRNLAALSAILIMILSSAISWGQIEPKYFLRAPDVLPGTLPEMRTPDFWIKKCKQPDRVILSPDKIAEKNLDFQSRMQEMYSLEHGLDAAIAKEIENWPGILADPPDLSSMSAGELAQLAKMMVDSQVRMLRKKKHGNILSIEYAPWEISAMEKEMAADQIGTTLELRQGITVRDCRIRVIPTLRPEYVAVGDKGRARWDMFNLDIVPIASWVRILHRSETGAYLLVLTSRGYGWIQSEDIAFHNPSEQVSGLPAQDFLICTGEKVPYYSGPRCEVVSGWLRMGDRIGYSLSDVPYTIHVPCRKTNGALVMEQAWLREDADVHRGFLPYTARNIVNQAFKLMDQVYDYTGAWFGRNHATILRDLFACFGFELPGNGILMKAYSPAGIVSPGEGKDMQYQAMRENQALVTIQIGGGHSQLYLGTHKKTPYVFDTHGYAYTGEDGKEYVIRRSCIYTPELPSYLLKGDLYFVKLN